MTSVRKEKYGKINRDKVLGFTWDNKEYFGYEGDSLASALLANDIKIVGRSFKYHRPRAVMSCGVEESGALVTIGSGSKTDPNVRATTQELYSGLIAKGQNAFPNVNYDFGGINNYLSRFFAAGFYYKTFMGLPPFEWGKGTAIWMVFEKIIRKAAGMGTASREPDPDNYEHAHNFCDILVIGSGPAGVAAAKEAVNKQLDVILIEPGPIKTPIWEKTPDIENNPFLGTEFEIPLRKFTKGYLAIGKKGFPPKVIGDKVVEIMNTNFPKTRYVITGRKWMDFILPGILPDRLLDKVFAKFLGINKEKIRG